MNVVDIICLGVMGFSLLIGLMQGFTKEILRVITWSSASAATYYGHSLVEPFLIPFVAKGIFLKGVSMGCVFVVVLITLNIISHTITYTVRGSMLRGIDGTLGMLLGGLRGSFILGSAYVLFLSFNPSGHQIPQFQNSKMVPFIEWGILEVAALAPENVTLKNLKDLILKRRKGIHTAVAPVISSNSSAIKSFIDLKKSSVSVPPPLTRRPVLTYVKELFHLPGGSTHHQNTVAPLTKPAYTPHQRDDLDHLVSSQEAE